MDVEIKVVTEATQEIADGLTRLLPQLLNHKQTVALDKLQAVIDQPSIKLFVATIGGRVVGTAQLSTFERTYGPMSWVDGVVVDENERGKGIAGKLMDAVLMTARELGLKQVNLTSSPRREAANHLYVKAGFELHETNYYRIDL